MSWSLCGSSFSYLIADINKYEIILVSVSWTCDFHPLATSTFWVFLVALLLVSIENLDNCVHLEVWTAIWWKIPSISWTDIDNILDFALVLAWL